MLDEIRRTARHTFVYGLGMISYRLVGFFLLPLYTKRIPVADYGLFGLLEVSGQVLVGLLSFGLPTALFKWYTLAEDNKAQHEVVSTVLIALLGFNLFFLGSIAILSLRAAPAILGFFPGSTLSTREFSYLLIAFYMDVLVTLVLRIFLNLLRAEERSGFYTIISVARFALVLGLNFWFIAKLGLGILGIYFGQALGSLFVLVAVLPWVSHLLVLSFRRELLRSMLAYGLPLVFVAVSVLLLNMGNRYLLGRLATLEEVGQYSLGQKIGNILYVILVQPFMTAYFPMIWRVSQENAEKFFVRTLNFYLGVGIWGVIAFWLFRWELTRIFARSASYLAGCEIVGIVSLAAVLYGAVYILHTSFYLSGRTSWITLLYLIGLAVNIGLAFWAIPVWGIRGAAWAVTVAYGLIAILSYPLAQRMYRINYELKRLARLGIVALLALVIGTKVGQGGTFSILLRALLVAGFPSLLIVIGAVRKSEVKTLVQDLLIVHRTKDEATRPVHDT